MSFPAYVRFGPLVLHPHWIFESLACTAGFCLYRRLRQRNGDVIDSRARWWVIAAVIIGGFAGSRILSAFEDPLFVADHWMQPRLFLRGKTIVVCLVGGLIAVESVKRLRGIRVATGDLLALPLVGVIVVAMVASYASSAAFAQPHPGTADVAH